MLQVRAEQKRATKKNTESFQKGFRCAIYTYTCMYVSFKVCKMRNISLNRFWIKMDGHQHNQMWWCDVFWALVFPCGFKWRGGEYFKMELAKKQLAMLKKKKKNISQHMLLRFLLNLSLIPVPVEAAVRPKSAGAARKPRQLNQEPFEKQLLRDIKTYEGPCCQKGFEVNGGSGLSSDAGCSTSVQLRSQRNDWKVSPSGSCRGFKTR